MTKNTSSGKTPELVTDLLQKAVAKKGQSAVARESGIALYSIQRYLKGIGEPTSKTLQKLADYFGVSVWELRGDDLTLELNKLSTSYETSNGTISKNIDIDSINGETKNTLLRLTKDLMLDIISRAPGNLKKEKHYVVSLSIENGKLVDASAKPIEESVSSTETNAITACNSNKTGNNKTTKQKREKKTD